MAQLWADKYVRVNKYTRPGTKLGAVKKIVLHWTANPGASAHNHFRYFDGTAIEQKRSASAHIFVDRAEAYCIVPLNEVAYHANDGSYRGVPALKPNANLCSLGVEMCVEKDGTIHVDTIACTAKIVAELCRKYKLDADDIVRHYDITHKSCPTPWVRKPADFGAFKKLVGAILKGGTISSKEEEEKTRMFNPSSNTLKNEVVTLIEEAHKKGVISSNDWVTKAKSGKLPLDDAVALVAAVYNRSK